MNQGPESLSGLCEVLTITTTDRVDCLCWPVRFAWCSCRPMHKSVPSRATQSRHANGSKSCRHGLPASIVFFRPLMSQRLLSLRHRHLQRRRRLRLLMQNRSSRPSPFRHHARRRLSLPRRRQRRRLLCRHPLRNATLRRSLRPRRRNRRRMNPSHISLLWKLPVCRQLIFTRRMAGCLPASERKSGIRGPSHLSMRRFRSAGLVACI